MGSEMCIRDSASGDGLEAAAREARYSALAETAAAMGEEHPAHVVLLGHTRDDQAEQVLLGLARGSGARSLAGMPALVVREGTPFVRPLLHLPRDTTEQACAAWGLVPWEDPMNSDRAYALSLIHISEPTRLYPKSRMPSSA